MTRNELKNLMPGYHIPPKKREPSKHEEADLHLSFCKWIRKEYPNLIFVRHEKEGKRSKFLQSLVKAYNSQAGLPDFELLSLGIKQQERTGFYIEFKKPGEKWLLKDGYTIKPDYEHQYEMHCHLWLIGRCVYFCNDLEAAKELFTAYVNGNPYPQQRYGMNLPF